MADISKITLPSNDEYNIKDATARSELSGKQDVITVDGILQGDGEGNITAADTTATGTLSNPSSDGTYVLQNTVSSGLSTLSWGVGGGGSSSIATTTSVLKGDGSGGAVAATAGTDYAAASHAHGDITSGGDITATAPTIASGDQLIINDNSASKITNGPTFDGSTTTKYLSQKGTWESVPTINYPVTSVNGETGAVVLDASDVNAVATSAVGANSGVAPLNASGKIDSTYLPSYVDDVIEGYYYNSKFYTTSAHTTEITGETGKIFVDLSTNKTYRYGGSSFTEISQGSVVSVSRDLTSGTKIGTLTINGTGTDLYAPTPETFTVTGGASTIVSDNLTANRALISNTNGKVAVSDVTSTELGYLDGVTSAIQTQINDKQAKITASGILKGDGSGGVTAATAGTDYAAASHAHGNITGGGDITATAPTIASGDQLIINDDSASKITNGPTFGTSTTTYLRNDGSWATPASAVTSVNGQTGSVSLTASDVGALSSSTVIPTVPTMDSTPTNGNSSNTVSSDGVYDMVMGRTKIYTATCSTAATTTAKVATLDDATGFSLAAGVKVAVTFTYGNNTTTPTLNINSTGDKDIVFKTDYSSAASGSGTTYNSWGTYETIVFTYDGSHWINGGSSLSIYRAYSLANSNGLPSQSGNSGKYLTTNGSAASWGSTVTVSEIGLDTTPTQNSTNLITSGAIYTAIIGAMEGSY